ncbi:hypothetical protein GCM10020229_21610 [Kitasatospora albolonga]|uniref:SCO2584 family spore wall biosynthesis protein n=1 Tax=Kitasatospora albolonga TaxID=68173 RepID=UPI0031EEBF2E
MAENQGGSPFPDGADHGGADEEFATVVLDEAFIRSAAVHEPSAEERRLAAAEARFEPETLTLGRGPELPEAGGLPLELRPHPAGLDDDRRYWDPWAPPARPARRSRWRSDGFDPGRAGAARSVAQQRWHRPIAWVLAVVMGVSVVAVAVAAIYRGTGGVEAPAGRPETGTSSPSDIPVPAPPRAVSLTG